MNKQEALRQYKKIDLQTSILKADAHRLVQMLFEGAIERLTMAKGHMERKEYELTGKKISLSIAIIGGLQTSLELKVGGDVARNLNDLYSYMQNRLLEANLKQDSRVIDEVIVLIKEIKSGWDEIPTLLKDTSQELKEVG